MVDVRGEKGNAPVAERKQRIDFPQSRQGEEGSVGELIGCGCGLSHPHWHWQRKASGVFHGIGAIGMTRTGDNGQSLANVRMKRVINRHGGRHGVVERVS